MPCHASHNNTVGLSLATVFFSAETLGFLRISGQKSASGTTGVRTSELGTEEENMVAKSEDLPDALVDKIVANMPTTRTCVGCDLCCTAVGVEEIGKLPGVRCPLLMGEPGKSCGVYDHRPKPCRSFLCLWRGSDTLLADNLFPPRVGFVVALTVGFETFPSLITVHPDPAHPHSWKAPRHRAVFKKLAADFNAIVVIGQHHLATYAFGPRGGEYSREKYPELFTEDGHVGIPSYEFFDFRLTGAEAQKLLWGR
jgi:hypothetical protein